MSGHSRLFETIRNKWLKIGAYLFWGVMTTLVNMAAFWLFRSGLSRSVLLANAIAWALAVLFAYVTNRAFVFRSNATTFSRRFAELARFIASRVFSGILDMALMLVTVHLLSFDEIIMKGAVNVVVVIVNYVMSELFVFKRGAVVHAATERDSCGAGSDESNDKEAT